MCSIVAKTANAFQRNLLSSQYPSPSLLKTAQVSSDVRGLVDANRQSLEVALTTPLQTIQLTNAADRWLTSTGYQLSAVVTRLDGLVNATVNSSTPLYSEPGFVVSEWWQYM